LQRFAVPLTVLLCNRQPATQNINKNINNECAKVPPAMPVYITAAVAVRRVAEGKQVQALLASTNNTTQYYHCALTNYQNKLGKIKWQKHGHNIV
jgi:hypothetical protein